MRLVFPLLSLTLICSFYDRHRQSYYEAVRREKIYQEVADKVVRKVNNLRAVLSGIGTSKLHFLMKDWYLWLYSLTAKTLFTRVYPNRIFEIFSVANYQKNIAQ